MLTDDEYITLTAEQQIAYERGSAKDKADFIQAWREGKTSVTSRQPNAPTSLMRSVGMAGTFIFGFIAVLVSIVGGVFWAAMVSGVFSLCVFMWMLGAIEQRLIIINETLRAQGSRATTPNW